MRIALQVLRIPVLLGLLVLLGPPVRTFSQAVARIDAPTASRAWAMIVAAALAFAFVALLGRASRHPPAVLVLEAVLAGLLGLVSPMNWIGWIGLSDLPTIMGTTAGSLAVPMLALAWFAIVVTTGVRQWRASRGPGDDAERAATGADTAG